MRGKQSGYVDLLESIKIGEIFFACDHKEVFSDLKRIEPLLTNKPHLGNDVMSCWGIKNP